MLGQVIRSPAVFVLLSLIAGLSLPAPAAAQARAERAPYAPDDPIFARMTGSPAAPGDGMAVNPRTGRRELVYATYETSESGMLYETGRYFASDGPLPRGAQSLAGYAPGYYSDNSSIFPEATR
jgi:hypothetical protein